MSDIIRLLPDSVANQIAAGEVIQRPASVVKELMENAVDAGASHIHVLVTDAGKTCVQVIDDGKGMSETDARLSFERHATSKIRQAADLFSLNTMGFRGEALASIAAVAQVELKTRQESDELGTLIRISGSRIESQEPVSCAVGCNFSVRNLFFNVPARRKFLKANSTELSNIVTEFERIALVNPSVNFSLYSNDTEIMALPASQLRQRILNVFGKKLNQQLLSLDVETSMVRIHGYVGRPETARKKGSRQYFFVNGRYMRHPYFHKAVVDAYEQLVPVGEQVSYFIYFEVDPANIDVNIHPTKTEIKFENEQSVWQILSAAVKESLGKFNAIPSIDFDTEDMPEIPAFEQDTPPLPPEIHYTEGYNPFDDVGGSVAPENATVRPARQNESGVQRTFMSKGSGGPVHKSVPDEWEDLYESSVAFSSKMNQESCVASVDSEGSLGLCIDSGPIEKGSSHLQFKGRFILTSVKSGLMLIDQHRAHVRILYDRFMEQIAHRHGVSQGVLFPEMLQLPHSESVVLNSIMDDLSAVGFELSDLGNGCFAINGIPSELAGANPVDLVYNMVHAAMEKGSDVKDEVRSLLALMLAKASAIVRGQSLSQEEMSALVDDLFACHTPNYTPDGKTILVTLQENEIERMFG